MVKLNKISTAFMSLILFAGIVAIGFAVQNPAILQTLIGIPAWAKIGAFLVAVFAIVFDYAEPRIKDVMVSGEELVVTQGMLTTFLMGLVTIVTYVIAMNPAILQPLLGNYFVSYGTMIGGIAMIGWNILKPRYGEFVNENTPQPIPAPKPDEEPDVITPEKPESESVVDDNDNDAV